MRFKSLCYSTFIFWYKLLIVITQSCKKFYVIFHLKTCVHFSDLGSGISGSGKEAGSGQTQNLNTFVAETDGFFFLIDKL